MKYLSVCSIFKNENAFLREWLDYHILAGVEHFYLACNDEDDTSAKEILSLYQDKITYCHLPGTHALQITHYTNVLNERKNDSRWIAFLDLDEFILPVEKDSIPAGLKEFEMYGGLILNMICFGASGLVDYPTSQTKQLTYRLPDHYGWPGHTWIKSIVNPKLAIRHRNNQPHGLDYIPGAFPVNTEHKVVWGHHTNPFISDKMRINHYYTRCEKWWKETKMVRGRADMPNAFNTYYWDTFLTVEEHATIKDTTIHKFQK